MNRKIKKSPIIVTGCARSGTSMVAGCIDIAGAFGGDLTGPTKWNPKGQHENWYIRDQIEKPYLRSINMDPLGQHPIADTQKDIQIPLTFGSEVENVMIRNGYKSGDWYYKGAKACQIWPVWNYAFPNAKWVIVRRTNIDIALSCMDTAFMRYYEDVEGWLEWVRIHEEKFVEMISAGLNVKQVWPERMTKGNYEQLYEVIEWLGLTWKSKEIIEWIDPKLFKSRRKENIKM